MSAALSPDGWEGSGMSAALSPDGWALANEPKGVMANVVEPRRRGALLLGVGKVLSDRLERYAREAMARLAAIDEG